MSEHVAVESERERLIAELEGARAKLVAENARLLAVERTASELVASVSHELRTPLSVIRGFAKLLRTRDLDPATRVLYLETLESEAIRLGALIDDFLDLHRIESGEFELSTEQVDLGTLARERFGVFSAQSPAHSFELDLPDGPLGVSAQPERIVQVITNLLSNAIKFSPAGGRIYLRGELLDGAVRISVGDHGVGIPAGQQQRVFERFFRADSAGTRGIVGTGLGLALCRQLVEAHGGRIGFESSEGQGSTFWFELAAAGEAREERLAQNEVVFRTVNEAIEQQAIEFGGLGGYEFLCECSSAGCFDRVNLTLAEYERVRSEGTRFFVAPGHQDLEVELVVETTAMFTTVEKDGAAGILTALADPRDGDPP